MTHLRGDGSVRYGSVYGSVCFTVRGELDPFGFLDEPSPILGVLLRERIEGDGSDTGPYTRPYTGPVYHLGERIDGDRSRLLEAFEEDPGEEGDIG